MNSEKKLGYNVVSNILCQIFVALSGFIITRFILKIHGSEVNGLINSLTQYIFYAGIVEMGVGNAAIVLLYGPLAEHEETSINRILSTARYKYLKSGIIYSLCVSSFILIYPFIVRTVFSYDYIVSLAFILSFSTSIDFFIIGKYKVLLTAAQRYYVINFAKIVATILLTVISAILLTHGASIHVVKLLAVLMHILEAAFIAFYSKKKYRYIYNRSDYIQIPQQKNALIHRICSMVTYNTDVFILSVFASGQSLAEVSVYSTYMLAFGALNNLMGGLTTGVEATFGEMTVKNDKAYIGRQFLKYELTYLFADYICWSCYCLLISLFIRCYTKGVTDVIYDRPGLGILFALNGLIATIKEPHGTIMKAYGHYKQTQKYCILESALNIVFTLLLVGKYGIVGCLIGTLIAHSIMFVCLVGYVDKVLLERSFLMSIKENLSGILLFIAAVFIGSCSLSYSAGWIVFIMFGILSVIISVLILSGLEYVFNKNYMTATIKDIRKILTDIMNTFQEKFVK